MPKTKIAKVMSEDLDELCDEALDRVNPSLLCLKCGMTALPRD